MLDRIQKHIAERDAIIEELKLIMVHADVDSPLEIELEAKWSVSGDEFRLQVEDYDLDDDGYSYTISSMGAKGEELFMGTKDGVTYIMAYEDNWRDTMIFVLKNENKNE